MQLERAGLTAASSQPARPGHHRRGESCARPRREPSQPDRARDVYKRDGSPLTPLEAAEYTWAYRAAVKKAAESPPPPPDPVAEAQAADAATQAGREEALLAQLRAAPERASEPVSYLQAGGAYHRFLSALDELVGGIDEMSEGGVRKAVHALHRSQRSSLAREHASVFSREERRWVSSQPGGDIPGQPVPMGCCHNLNMCLRKRIRGTLQACRKHANRAESNVMRECAHMQACYVLRMR